MGGIINTYVSCTEEYNGTSWSSGGALICERYLLAGAGTQNAGLASGSPTQGGIATDEYNGTSWSAGGVLITPRTTNQPAGAGTQNDAFRAGGNNYGSTEEYNGTSWTAGGAMIVARSCLAGAGTPNAGLVMGGWTNTIVTCTEEYNKSLQIVDSILK